MGEMASAASRWGAVEFPVLQFHLGDGIACGFTDAATLAKYESRGDVSFFREANVIDAEGVLYRTEVCAKSVGPFGWLAERLGLWDRPRTTTHRRTGETYSLDGLRSMLLPILRAQEMWEENVDQEELDAALDNAKDLREFYDLLKYRNRRRAN
jgi:hypothetical protein